MKEITMPQDEISGLRGLENGYNNADEIAALIGAVRRSTTANLLLATNRGKSNGTVRFWRFGFAPDECSGQFLYSRGRIAEEENARKIRPVFSCSRRSGR
jgi:hypothetical protein